MKKIGLLLLAMLVVAVAPMFAESDHSVSGKIRYQVEYNTDGANEDELTDFLKDSDLKLKMPNSSVTGYLRFSTPNLDADETQIKDLKFDRAYLSVDMIDFFDIEDTLFNFNVKAGLQNSHTQELATDVPGYATDDYGYAESIKTNKRLILDLGYGEVANFMVSFAPEEYKEDAAGFSGEDMILNFYGAYSLFSYEAYFCDQFADEADCVGLGLVADMTDFVTPLDNLKVSFGFDYFTDLEEYRTGLGVAGALDKLSFSLNGGFHSINLIKVNDSYITTVDGEELECYIEEDVISMGMSVDYALTERFGVYGALQAYDVAEFGDTCGYEVGFSVLPKDGLEMHLGYNDGGDYNAVRGTEGALFLAMIYKF